MKGVILVIRVLDAAVWLNFGRVGQVDRIALGPQPVHQPIPVEGGLDRHGLELWFEWRQELSHCFEITVQLPVRHALSVLVHHTDHYVVAVQIDSCDQLLIGSSHGFSLLLCCFVDTDNNAFTVGRPSSQPPLMFIRPYAPLSGLPTQWTAGAGTFM